MARRWNGAGERQREGRVPQGGRKSGSYAGSKPPSLSCTALTLATVDYSGTHLLIAGKDPNSPREVAGT